jgi:hypothetical protein
MGLQRCNVVPKVSHLDNLSLGRAGMNGMMLLANSGPFVSERNVVYLLSAPLLPSIASRNLLLLQSLPYQHSTSVCQCKEAKRWALCGHGGERTC